MALPGQDKRKGIEQYEHRDRERLNNPPVGLVTPETDPKTGRKKTYAYDPHLDPQLVWAGKAEHTSFEVPTVSLHVHERIDPRTIIETLRKKNGNGGAVQLPLFETERKEPLREAIEFYKHAHGWSNRLIAGDSLLVMNSLLEKEGMAGKVQMIYIHPPYGIKYGSNFQPFVNKRDVKDGKDEDLTAEPEQIRAFRDTWELGIHSYLTYLRDRLLLARELLSESGSIFVQINDENVHHVRELMDEVFGARSFVAAIAYRVFGVRAGAFLDSVTDNVIWCGKDRRSTKYRRLFLQQAPGQEGFEPVRLYRPGYSDGLAFGFHLDGRAYSPPSNMHWATGYDGLRRLEAAGRLVGFAADTRYRRWASDFPCGILTTSWQDTWGEQEKSYAVQTSSRVIERCLLMTTDPGDLVFDPTCVRRETRVWCSPSPTLPVHGEGALYSPRVRGDERGAVPQVRVEGPTHRNTRNGEVACSPRVRGDEEAPVALRQRQHSHSPRVRGDERGAVPLVRGEEEDASLSRDNAPPYSPRVRGDERGARLIPIEAIQPGDWVLAHDGEPHRVLRVTSRHYRGSMIGISHQLSDKTLWLTADHRVLARTRPRSLGGRVDWSGIPRPLRGRSRELRRDMTPPERKLWAALRCGRTGFTFRRQHPIGHYIADFYSRGAQLVVEVDGAVAHGTQAAIVHDAARDAYLQSLGLRVLRIPARDVERDLEGVCEAVRLACEEQTSPQDAAWIEARDLCVGDVVFFGPERLPARIVDLRPEPTEEEVYDLEVEGAHSFLTEVCAVHNCGSGTAAYVAEKWGRRWITCDTSRLARNLKAEIDEQLIEAYRGTESLPFELGEHRRIAVKIVDDRGIESLKVIDLTWRG